MIIYRQYKHNRLFKNETSKKYIIQRQGILFEKYPPMSRLSTPHFLSKQRSSKKLLFASLIRSCLQLDILHLYSLSKLNFLTINKELTRILIIYSG